jgi:hypothetical protein
MPNIVTYIHTHTHTHTHTKKPPLCMCVSLCRCVMYMYICVCMSVSVHTYHIPIQTHSHTHKCMHTCVCEWVCSEGVRGPIGAERGRLRASTHMNSVLNYLSATYSDDVCPLPAWSLTSSAQWAYSLGFRLHAFFLWAPGKVTDIMRSFPRCSVCELPTAQTGLNYSNSNGWILIISA